jgi:TolA-binding protein
MAVYTWAWLPFVVFVIVTGFVVVNLIIAVICDAISALHDDDKKKLHGTFEEDETTNNESIHPALQEDVREQLGALEDHVEELTRMQEQTLNSLAMLTRQIQLQRLARSQSEPQPKPQLQQAPALSTHPVVVGGVGVTWRPS